MGRDPKPTPQSRAATRTVEKRSEVPPAEVYHGGGGSISSWGSPAAARALLGILIRDDGWLRVTPKEDGETVYWKWKWTAGPHVNHYVMVVYHSSESSEAITRLALKIDAVDRGEQTPVKDHYFKGEGS